MFDGDLTFEYNLPRKVVYDWWTDLSNRIPWEGPEVASTCREGEKVIIETRWRVLGMDLTLQEKLSLYSEEHSVWEPHMLGIGIVDDFADRDRGRKGQAYDSLRAETSWNEGQTRELLDRLVHQEGDDKRMVCGE